MKKLITVENHDYNLALNELMKKVQTELDPTEEITLNLQYNFLHEVVFSNQKDVIYRVSFITK